MPRRFHVLANNEIYHVFNRSVGHEDIFNLNWNLNRAITLIDYYRFPQRIRYSRFKTLPKEARENYLTTFRKQAPLVEIFAFALMPNHYHLLVKQLQDKGISMFISNVQNSFAKYFNLRNRRHGTLFQNPFRAKRVETDEEFIHISRYIHLNPVTSYLLKFNKLSTFPWTSFSWYVYENKNKFVVVKTLLEIFKTKEKYLEFITDQVDYQRKLQEIKHLIIE